MESGARCARPAGVAAMNGPLGISLTAPVDGSLNDGVAPAGRHIQENASLISTMDGVTSALRLSGAYVRAILVGRMTEGGTVARPVAERQRITVMVRDVEGYTTLAKGVPREELMRVASTDFEGPTAEPLARHATTDEPAMRCCAMWAPSAAWPLRRSAVS